MPRETDRWTEGQRNGQTLFYRTLPATPGHPKSLPKRKGVQKKKLMHYGKAISRLSLENMYYISENIHSADR